MKKHQAGIGLVLGGLLTPTLGAQGTNETSENPTVTVGTFDSRAVAIACVRSDAFADRMRALHAELDQARTAGDDKRVAELEAMGPAMQKQIHGQGFGTAPVDDIIARIEDELSGIAKEAGVHVIAPKWALAYRRPAAKFVDVTDRLAAELDPDAETLKVIRETVASEPIPQNEFGRDH